MRVVILGILLSIPWLTYGQAENEVSMIELIKEIQQWDKKGNRMSLAWWIPNEYWRIALQDNKQVPPEAIDQLEEVFGDYFMIWTCDLMINAGGTMSFTAEEEMRKSLLVIDGNGKKYSPLERDQMDFQVLTIVENMKPLFSQALGQMGQGIHFFFFKVKDQSGKNLVDAKRPGEFKVLHSSSEFFWKLPLATFLPPKFCPVDKEKMKGTWSYCPIHGQKL